MAYTVEMEQEETIALRALDDQVSAPEKARIEPRAARQPCLAGIGWVPGQGWVVCSTYSTLETDWASGFRVLRSELKKQRETKTHVNTF